MLEFLKQNIDITNLSNFKTKAKTKYYYEINSLEDLENIDKIIKFAQKEKIKFIFIGGGTNILFAFDIYNGIIIKNKLKGWNYDEKTKILESYSSENISSIAVGLENKYKQNLWHRFIGLPGSIGGAVYGNAGCFGLETENNFLEAEVLNLNNYKKEILFKKDMGFEYRNSLLKKSGNYFLIKTKFDLSQKIEKYSSNEDNVNFREIKQPGGNTCGSFFKNPSKEYPAGKLIEEVGLKGYKLGGAYFSDKHANFLINDGTGTYTDLLDLVSLAQKKVKEKFGLDLIQEVIIVYNK